VLTALTVLMVLTALTALTVLKVGGVDGVDSVGVGSVECGFVVLPVLTVLSSGTFLDITHILY
jgi:hypothetical protein